jgi:hypothetical protein
MTNPNKHLRVTLRICVQNYSHGTPEQRYSAGFALKAGSKNEPLKKFKGPIIYSGNYQKQLF